MVQYIKVAFLIYIKYYWLMELRHLKYFVTVAEELHFGRAAQRVGIAQPPFSQQIKALELELGTALLLRSKRHVELTAAGRAFLAEARKILAQAGEAVRIAQRAARGEIGRLTIGFVNSAVYGRFASVFGLMRARYPEVVLSLQDLTSEEQVEAMKAHKLDVGLVRPPVIAAESLALRVIGREPLMVALPRGHRLAREKQLRLQDLAEESFLLIPRHLGPGFYDQVVGLCAQAGFVPRVVQEARATQTIVSLIAGGMGLSLVPSSLQNLRRAGVVYRPLKRPAPTTDLAAIWRPEESSPVLQSFLNLIWQVAELSPKPKHKPE
jgi:DNA-binding transcriptional LysR family regulator